MSAAVGVAVACGAAPVAEPAAVTGPKKGGTVVIAGAANPLTLDPGAITDGASQLAASLFFEGLVKYNAKMEVVPDLAESWTADGLNWTFKLRKGVTFHDGAPFNATAAKAHFDRMIAEKLFGYSSYTPYLDKTEVVDESTVRFVTKTPYAFFLNLLAEMSAKIESPDAVKKFGKDIIKNPVGTGPFKFVEWLKDTHVKAVRNEAYWGEKAYLDGVMIRPVGETEPRAIGLEAGDIHMTTGITPEQRIRLRQNKAIDVLEVPGLTNTFVGMNVLKKPFSDIRVRQALNYAVDKEAIVKDMYAGAADVLPGTVAIGVPGAAPTTPFKYDPAKAKQLLADAGYPNGFSTTLLSSNQYAKDLELITFLQQQYKAVGVTIKLDQLEWAKYLELLRLDPRNSPVEMWRDGRGGNNAGDTLLRTYGCDFFRPGGGNTNGYCNKDLDALSNEAVRTLDQTKRDTLLKQAQEQMAQQAPSVWLIAVKQVAASSKKVHDPLFLPTGFFTVTNKTWME